MATAAKAKPQLTDKQLAVLNFVKKYLKKHKGLPPTIQEIADGMGYSQGASVVTHLDALERKEFITRERNKARGIRIVE